MSKEPHDELTTFLLPRFHSSGMTRRSGVICLYNHKATSKTAISRGKHDRVRQCTFVGRQFQHYNQFQFICNASLCYQFSLSLCLWLQSRTHSLVLLLLRRRPLLLRPALCYSLSLTRTSVTCTHDSEERIGFFPFHLSFSSSFPNSSSDIISTGLKMKNKTQEYQFPEMLPPSST